MCHICVTTVYTVSINVIPEVNYGTKVRPVKQWRRHPLPATVMLIHPTLNLRSIHKCASIYRRKSDFFVGMAIINVWGGGKDINNYFFVLDAIQYILAWQRHAGRSRKIWCCHISGSGEPCLSLSRCSDRCIQT